MPYAHQSAIQARTQTAPGCWRRVSVSRPFLLGYAGSLLGPDFTARFRPDALTGDCRGRSRKPIPMGIRWFYGSRSTKRWRRVSGGRGIEGLVPNPTRHFFLGRNHEDNLCPHVHFVVQFVCCCHSPARSIRCTDRKVPSCTIMLAGQEHLRDPRRR